MSFKPRTYPMIFEHMTPYVVQVEQVLERGVAAGEIRDDRPVDQLALVFVGFQVLLFVQHGGSGGELPSLEEDPGSRGLALPRWRRRAESRGMRRGCP